MEEQREEIGEQSRILRNEVVSAKEARTLIDKAETDWDIVRTRVRKMLNRMDHRGDILLRPRQGRKRGLGRNRATKRGKVHKGDK